MGAWLNDRRLQTSATDQLEQALLATGFPPDMRGQDYLVDWWRYFGLRAQAETDRFDRAQFGVRGRRQI